MSRSGRIAAPLLAAALALPLLLAAAPAHADFAQGVKAYEAGDYRSAYEAWLPLAEKGDVAAMRNIGHLYRWGQGVDKNIEEAVRWYRKAAESGFSRAQANLAAIYLQGDEGVAVNYEEAHKWFAAAAIQGLAVAQYNLGLMYELGLGVEKSEPRALGWYNIAAKAGQQEAIDRLSQLVRHTENKAPLVSGVKVAEPQAAPTDTASDTATMTPAPAAEPQQAAVAPVAPAVVAAPLPAPAGPAKSEVPADKPVAATSVEDKPVAEKPIAETPVEEKPAEPERPGFLSRFYSAISSGGGVSIPDMFDSADDGATDKERQP